jgi:hypothetical protein
MYRIALLGSLVALTLAACERSPTMLLRAAVAPSSNEQVLVTGSQITRNEGPKLAYTHDLLIEMSDDKVAPRFERARTSCLEDQSLNCNLIEASITVGDANAGVRPNAKLSVRLPHDAVMKFEAGLLQSLPGEGQGEPSLRRSSTNAEDLTYAILDLDRRLAQANDYRDRLAALSRRADAKVDDLIKVQDKLSEVQSSIEDMTAQTRRLNTRVDTELLNISLGPYASLTSVSSPLGEAWRNSARALGESTATAFTFVVVVLPWLPLLAFVGFLLAWLWRFISKVRRRGGRTPVLTPVASEERPRG